MLLPNYPILSAITIRNPLKTGCICSKASETEMNRKYGEKTVTLTITDSYSNMLEVIKDCPHVVEIAKNAISAVGLEPLSRPVRGGTDGARLSFMGLPCPNLGTGGYGFHGPYEHVGVEGMETAVKNHTKYCLYHCRRFNI